MAVRGLTGESLPGPRPLGCRAILLDALGTLVELEPPAPRLKVELGRRLDVSVTEAQAGQAIRAEMVYYRAHLDEGRDEPSLTRLRERCAEVLWRALPGMAGRSPPPERLVETLMASLNFRAFADAPPALASLRELGLRLIVVSNWDVSLPGVLDRVGLAGWLDGIVTSAQLGVRKPDRAIFDHALRLAGVGRRQAIHVGDSLREDFEGARAAGIEAVLLSRDVAERDKPAEISQIATLRELPVLLGRRRL